MEEEFRTRPTQLGWTDRQGRTVASFVAKAEETAENSRSLKWIVDPFSKTPVWIQLVILFLKHRVLRIPLPK